MLLKACAKCSIVKPLEEFNKKRKSLDGHQTYCRACASLKLKAFYVRNKARLVIKATANRKRYKARNKQIIMDFLTTNPCVDCGETDPIVLDFDHVNHLEKSNNISAMFEASADELRAEIAKCVSRCANCHRRRTYIQFGYTSRHYT